MYVSIFIYILWKKKMEEIYNRLLKMAKCRQRRYIIPQGGLLFLKHHESFFLKPKSQSFK